MERQATATREISNSVQTVTANTAKAADAMQQVLGIVEDTTASSRAALQASDDVSRTAETLSSEVTIFSPPWRAAMIRKGGNTNAFPAKARWRR